jgi:peptidoglycan/xylan/chitin deacetylase (PgdA/CDA1 family)
MIRIKNLVKYIIASRIGWPMMSLLFRKRGITVLMYHRVTRPGAPFEGLDVSLFHDQMRWLRRHCTPIRPEELLLHTRNTRWRRPPVLVTFDDGYRDYYENAFPILRDLEIPSLVFVATSFMDNGGLLWTETVHWAVAQAAGRRARLPWSDGEVFDLSSERERERFVNVAKSHLKQVPDAKRKQGLEQFLGELGVSPGQAVIERQMMTWDEVRATLGLAQIGGHSHTHPIMSQLDERQMEFEIKICSERIESQTGRRPKYFAYPNGRQQDFNELTRQLLRRYGFELAFSTIAGINGAEMDDMAIRRQPTGAASTGDFACLVAGM